MVELSLDKKNNIREVLTSNDSKSILGFLECGKVEIDGTGFQKIDRCSYCGSHSSFFKIHIYPKRWTVVTYDFIFFVKVVMKNINDVKLVDVFVFCVFIVGVLNTVLFLLEEFNVVVSMLFFVMLCGYIACIF